MTLDTKQSIFTEVADFLATQPTLEQLAAYKVSPAVQAHIDNLLERNREGTLSSEERLQFEKILAVSHVMTLTKTKARLKLADNT